jgi:hypothetical protein
MRVIIAGGRYFYPVPSEIEAFRKLWRSECEGAELVHGACPTGTDAWANGWALEHSIPVKPFDADWQKHAKAAGPIRNGEMATYAARESDSALIWWPGGAGTLSMRRIAAKQGLRSFQAETFPLGDLCRRIEAVLRGDSSMRDLALDSQAPSLEVAARRDIFKRYAELKRFHDFRSSAILARLEWLESELEEREF